MSMWCNLRTNIKRQYLLWLKESSPAKESSPTTLSVDSMQLVWSLIFRTRIGQCCPTAISTVREGKMNAKRFKRIHLQQKLGWQKSIQPKRLFVPLSTIITISNYFYTRLNCYYDDGRDCSFVQMLWFFWRSEPTTILKLFERVPLIVKHLELTFRENTPS